MRSNTRKLFPAIVILTMMLTFTVTHGGTATAAPSQAISLAGGTYTQNFDTLSNTAATTTNSLTIPDWYMTESGGGARDNELYAVDTGGSGTGDTYSYGSTSATDRALGGLQSGTLIPLFGAQFTNDTGATITSLAISYYGEEWRLGTAARTDQIDFQLSLDATSLVTGTWTDYNSLDFVTPVIATTGAKDGNAAANRTLVSYTITGLSIANGATFWIRWSDFNASGADDGLAVDDFSITPNGAPVAPNLSINDVSQSEGNAGTTTFAFTVSLSAPAPVGGVTFDIATADNSATVVDNDYAANSLTGQTIPAGSSTYTFNVTVNGDTNVEADESFFVNVTNVAGANVTDGQGLGTINNDDVTAAFVHDIQGSGSAVTGSGPFTVEAIVVGDFQAQTSGQLKGFFIQEEDADADANPATSEGIFVYCNTCPDAVNVGDKVQVTGTASEYFNMSQISATTLGSVVVQSTGNTLPTPASLTLPVPGVPTGDLAAATAYINNYYEPFEGMLVTFPATLYVTEQFELARYGQVELSAIGRPFTFTAVNPPTASGYTNHQIDLLGRTIILDDTDNRENRPIDTPNTAYFHPIPGFSTSNYFRGGDTITGLTGVLHWSFAGGSSPDAWRIRPVTEAYSYAFTASNPRPSAPTVSGRLKIASFNVLNYFLTIDATSSSSSGSCGPALTVDCRGADNATELSRQRTKMLAALSQINADVFGFMELENTTGVEPLADIVAGLNALVGPGTYDYIDTGVIGGDTIRVGIIYKTATVAPVGSYAILDSSVDPLFDDTRNRPALAQTFEEIASGERFTVAVNHFKSKGSSCGAGDDDTTTGQGNCNGTRTNAANALAAWLALDPTGSGDPDYLIIGDLNSYAMEDPITALLSAGYTNLVSAFGGSSAYGYVFDGQLGYLDHALSNASLTPQVAALQEWHINSDENPLFDYNDDVKDTGESTFEEKSDTNPLYDAGPYRTSDHDPLIIGLNLDATPPAVTVPGDMTVESTNLGATVFFSASALDNVDGPLTPACVPASGSFFALGTTLVTCSATDSSGNTGSASFNVNVVDTIPPSITVPADITVEATGPSGANVGYTVTYKDNGSGIATYGCVPAGPLYPLGTTNVVCSATDGVGNGNTASFNINVVDTTAPILSLPANMTVPQNVPGGAVVNFTVTATDVVDANPAIVCNPPSGSTFPPGVTTVNCTATDDYSNSSSGSFNVTVTGGVNLLKKPDFPNAFAFPFPWKVFNLRPPYTGALDCNYYLSPPCSVVFGPGNHAAIQQVNRIGAAGDTYSFGMWSAAQNVPTGGNYSVEVTFYNNFNHLVGRHTIAFNPNTHGFEIANGSVSASGNYNKIVFRFTYNASSGRAWFDDAFLYFLPTPP